MAFGYGDFDFLVVEVDGECGADGAYHAVAGKYFKGSVFVVGDFKVGFAFEEAHFAQAGAEVYFNVAGGVELHSGAVGQLFDALFADLGGVKVVRGCAALLLGPIVASGEQH